MTDIQTELFLDATDSTRKPGDGCEAEGTPETNPDNGKILAITLIKYQNYWYIFALNSVFSFHKIAPKLIILVY